MAGRGLMAALVAAGFGLLIMAIRFPHSALDIYLNDRYVAVSKRALVTLTLLIVLIPVFIAAVRLKLNR